MDCMNPLPTGPRRTSLPRRDFLVRTGLLLGMGVMKPVLRHGVRATSRFAGQTTDWASVKAEFNIDTSLIHMSAFFLASHPRPVRDAIERHRRGLDANPLEYVDHYEQEFEEDVLQAASAYLGVSPTDIALTDSTTMGLGLLYGGLKLQPTQEILTTVHDHYSTEQSIELRARRSGASVRKVALYRNPATASVDEIVGSLTKAITARTRYVAVTWVHSSTGVKLPIRDMADAIARANASRDEADRIIFCVDGVHGLGVEDVQMSDLCCDFFVAGTHKWLFGPRGTGLVWGAPHAWPLASATIPTFDRDTYMIWMKINPPKAIPPGPTMTPGGFHSFEHRWAVGEAFRFHQEIGKGRIADRIHHLNTRLKRALLDMNHITLRTPLNEHLSAGIVCFEHKSLHVLDLLERLRRENILASITPYATLYMRLAPSLLTTDDDVDRTIQVLAKLKA